MSMLTDNHLPVKESRKIIKYEDLEIKIEKMRHLKTTTGSIIVGTLGMLMIGTDKHINNIPDCPSLYEKKNLYFAELLISKGVLFMWMEKED